VTSKPDFKVMVLLLVFMQLTRDLFAIAKFLLSYAADRRALRDRNTHTQTQMIAILTQLLWRECSSD